MAKRSLSLAAILLASSGLAHAQRLQFEAATIKPAADATAPFAVEMKQSYVLHARSASLKQLVLFAYDLPGYLVTGGPDWFDKLRFDVSAKGLPPPPEDPNDPAVLEAATQRFRLMLQSLLDDRFGLKTRRETREMAVYNLGVTRGGSKLKESTARRSVHAAFGRMGGMGVSAGQIARMIAQQAGRPVVDQTRLNRTYDFELVYTPETPAGANPPRAADPNAPSLFTAVQEQLGLRLAAGRGAVELLVIDAASLPTEN